jgi:hypothetical protein
MWLINQRHHSLRNLWRRANPEITKAEAYLPPFVVDLTYEPL